MEFHEKLQTLRKQKGLTQEELAGLLFVSRAAVSKWESGRGYPGIDSLKAIARFFSVSIDDLLSGDELLHIAEENTRKQQMQLRDLVFGLLDFSAVLLLFLPLFGHQAANAVQAVSLPCLAGASPLVTAAYWTAVIAMMLLGVLTFILQHRQPSFWQRNKSMLSITVNAAGTLLLIAGRQSYAAALLFVFLAVKVMMLLKKP